MRDCGFVLREVIELRLGHAVDTGIDLLLPYLVDRRDGGWRSVSRCEVEKVMFTGERK